MFDLRLRLLETKFEKAELDARTDDKPPLADRVVALETRCAELESLAYPTSWALSSGGS